MKHAQDLGEILRKARESKGLSVDDIHKKTLIHSRVIEDLESGTQDDRLSGIYRKAFARKYAQFLGLDAERLLKDFRLSTGKQDEQKLHIDPSDNYEFDIKKYIPHIATGAAVVLVIFVIAFGVVRFTRFIGARMTRPAARTAEKKKGAARPAAAKTPARKKIVPKTGSRTSKPVSGPVTLTLRTTDEVWLKVVRDGSTVFNGTLEKDAVESWDADRTLNLRVGKPEKLSFIVNGKDLGFIGKAGYDIVVDARGILVGNERIAVDR